MNEDIDAIRHAIVKMDGEIQSGRGQIWLKCHVGEGIQIWITQNNSIQLTCQKCYNYLELELKKKDE